METAIVADRLNQSIFVMPGLAPGIHAFLQRRWIQQAKTWMAGSSPAMTNFPLSEENRTS
ncbi:hypothetical protein ASC80_15230 [Afipia sp. Root123D2]|uniref:hypothetical protein n=1 Tax=Afipia sp. Root123D2 TaxID=1736436 RepID=UPI0006F559DE|nr:hypothetical protein [Afipia sp. Root123D2]KQW18855.1 hypothetical protein ASC80_15230 [Afipia sp. Root123D2]